MVLFGDKTALTKPSAFDRINVRRLFLLLEKAIATVAKFQLFEFNDEFTRAQFRNLVEPFLRDIQGRRGITDFSVKGLIIPTILVRSLTEMSLLQISLSNQIVLSTL